MVGKPEGLHDGDPDGCTVGTEEGQLDGVLLVGIPVGSPLGALLVGIPVGWLDGELLLGELDG